MTGSEICERIITSIQEEISTPQFVEKHRVGNHFTRLRKLTMELLIIFLFFKSKQNLANNISGFYNRFQNIVDNIVGKQFDSISKQAISKARQGINIDAFEWIFAQTSRIYFQYATDDELWNGFHILAIDGSIIQLPQRENVFRIYGTQKVKNDGEFPLGRASCLYSCSSHIIVDAILETSDIDERELACRHADALAKTDIASNAIVTMDRGYYSTSLCRKLFDNKIHFVFRMKKSSRYVRDLMRRGGRSMLITIGTADDGTPLKVRVVRVTLNTGEIEYLLTDLLESGKFFQNYVINIR